jgi:hypothetical protein
MQGTLSFQVNERRRSATPPLPRFYAMCDYGEIHSGDEDPNALGYKAELAVSGCCGS